MTLRHQRQQQQQQDCSSTTSRDIGFVGARKSTFSTERLDLILSNLRRRLYGNTADASEQTDAGHHHGNSRQRQLTSQPQRRLDDDCIIEKLAKQRQFASSDNILDTWLSRTDDRCSVTRRRSRSRGDDVDCRTGTTFSRQRSTRKSVQFVEDTKSTEDTGSKPGRSRERTGSRQRSHSASENVPPSLSTTRRSIPDVGARPSVLTRTPATGDGLRKSAFVRRTCASGPLIDDVDVSPTSSDHLSPVIHRLSAVNWYVDLADTSPFSDIQTPSRSTRVSGRPSWNREQSQEQKLASRENISNPYLSKPIHCGRGWSSEASKVPADRLQTKPTLGTTAAENTSTDSRKQRNKPTFVRSFSARTFGNTFSAANRQAAAQTERVSSVVEEPSLSLNARLSALRRSLIATLQTDHLDASATGNRPKSRPVDDSVTIAESNNSTADQRMRSQDRIIAPDRCLKPDFVISI